MNPTWETGLELTNPAPMEATETRSKPFQIGEWEADSTLNLVRRGRATIHIEPKAMELLCFLARRPGEVISREELLSTLWQGLVVGDDALTQAVIKLRKALGDSPRRPAYIQTVPKRGYRLIAQVEAERPKQARPPDAEGSPRRPLRALVNLTLALAVVSIPAASTFLYLTAAPFNLHQAQHPHDGGAHKTTPETGPTVSVLPFQVIGNDPEQLYLARGLAAELASDLSTLSGLTAVGADTLPGTSGEGAETGARTSFQVWGGVQRTKEQISVEVRLVETATGRQLWSQRYDRPFGDLFAIQEDVGARLAETLSVQVSDAEQRRLAQRFSSSVEAYDLFLRAREALLVRRYQDNGHARDLLHRAIEADPAFARAYGGLALTYAADYRNQWTQDREGSLSRALEMAETAVQIDPNLPEAHWVMAYVSAQRRYHDEALDHLDRALSLAPAFGDALALKGGVKTYIGDPLASINLLRGAMRLNPAAGYLYFLLLGRAYFFLDDPEQALINLREAAARNPANLETRVYLAATLERIGDRSAARWEAEEISAIEPDFSTTKWLETYPMTDSSQAERLASILARLGL